MVSNFDMIKEVRFMGLFDKLKKIVSKKEEVEDISEKEEIKDYDEGLKKTREEYFRN